MALVKLYWRQAWLTAGLNLWAGYETKHWLSRENEGVCAFYNNNDSSPSGLLKGCVSLCKLLPGAFALIPPLFNQLSSFFFCFFFAVAVNISPQSLHVILLHCAVLVTHRFAQLCGILKDNEIKIQSMLARCGFLYDAVGFYPKQCLLRLRNITTDTFLWCQMTWPETVMGFWFPLLSIQVQITEWKLMHTFWKYMPSL